MRPNLLAFALVTAGSVAGVHADERTSSLDWILHELQLGNTSAAVAALDSVLAGDPTNRRARELRAFAFETEGDLSRELGERAALARDYPRDADLLAAYARVLERAGDETEAKTVYRHAREIGGPSVVLDEAIERMVGRNDVEVGVVVAAQSDPAASATRMQVGTAVPVAERTHVAFVTTGYRAVPARGRDAAELGAVALTLSVRRPTGAWIAGGPRAFASEADDVTFGGSIAGVVPLRSHLVVDARGDITTLWDDAAVAIRHAGQQTGATSHAYVHAFDRRLLVQVGGVARQLSLAPLTPSPMRPTTSQVIGVGGVDFVVWRRPVKELRGQFLDDRLATASSTPSALTLSYRHYESFAHPSQSFASIIAVPRRSTIDEISQATSFVLLRRSLAVAFPGGVGRDAVRGVWLWRAGGTLSWTPTPSILLALRYESTTEIGTGFTGRRKEGWLSCHVDL